MYARLLEDFESLTGWSASGDGTQALDEVNFRTGSAALKLSSTGYLQSVKTVSMDFSDEVDMAFWVHVVNVAKLFAIRLLLSSSATWWDNYFSKTILATNLVTGWNYIRLAKADFTTTGALSWDDVITTIIVDDSAIAEQTAIISYDSIYSLPLGGVPVARKFLLSARRCR